MKGLALLLAAALCLGARAQELPPGGESFALFQGLHRVGRLEVRVPSGVAERAMVRLLHPLEGRADLRFTVNAAERDPGAVRVLAGLAGDPEIAPLATTLGLEDLGPGFRVLGREFRAPGDALVAVFEDPERAGQPLCLFVANDLELLAAYFTELPRLSRPFLRVFDDGDLALACPLQQDGRPRADELRDHRARREEYFSGTEKRENVGLSVHARSGGDARRQAQWQVYSAALLEARKRVRTWFPSSPPTTPAEVFVYEHVEDFERCLGESQLAVVNRLHARVHVLLCPGLPDDGGAGLARVVARELAGQPAAAWLEDGLAVAAAGSWWGRPLAGWVKHLDRAGLLPAASELVAPLAVQRLGEHVALPASALLFRRLVDAAGDPARTRALWKGADPAEAKVFEDYAKGLAQGAPGKEGESPRVAPPTPATSAPFRHGIALVEGPEGPKEGYSTRAVAAALDRSRAIEPGPDALSLTVFATAEDPEEPTCARPTHSCHGSASDLALANAVAEGTARGMRTLLALEVLAQPSGSWADTLSWAGENDRELFWVRYQRIALHYALLAELTGVEVLSVGSNLREVARTEPRAAGKVDPELLESQLEFRRKGWAALLTSLRSAYGGGLTYCARFPTEAQEVGFYDQLDFVGLSLFPRLPGAERTPADDELRRVLRLELEEALELAVRWNKPLLLLQLGFPARASSWSKPFLPRGARDPEAQRRFFAALADVLSGKLENRDVLQGFFLWNWPVEESPGSVQPDYALSGQALESLLPRLFAR